MNNIRLPLLVILLLLGAAFAAELHAQQPLAAPQLFGEPAAAAQVLPDDPMLLRMRAVSVDQRLLADGRVQRIELPLFAGLRLTAERQELLPARNGFVWSGSVVGDPDGSVVLSVVGEALAGTIRTQDQLYRVQYGGNGVHFVTQLDEEEAPACGSGDEHLVGPASGAGAPLAPPSAPAGGGQQQGTAGNPQVDVLVVYTTRSRLSAGGPDGINSVINLAVAETNQAYENSDILQRLSLVWTEELDGYTENGDFGIELARLRARNDGWNDQVHQLRDTHGADCVAMIINSTQYCGMAYLMTNPGAAFASSAFSVTSRGCATSFYSFAHELGHNMGCAHDRDNASNGAYSFSFGFRTSNNQYRTVMAYSPGIRIRYFSNPNKFLNGNPLGNTHPSADSAENWQTLNDTATIVTGWRQARTDFTLRVPFLVGGQTTTLEMRNATPGGAALFAYSLAGGGTTNTPYGPLELSAPIKNLNMNADANGSASRTVLVPLNAVGRTVWMQGVDLASGNPSNPISLSIF